jgi:hypothetical protein
MAPTKNAGNKRGAKEISTSGLDGREAPKATSNSSKPQKRPKVSKDVVSTPSSSVAVQTNDSAWAEHISKGTSDVVKKHQSKLIRLVFTVDPPKKFSPWPFEYVEATVPYEKDIACPIDWSQLPPLKATEIMAYEIRKPWNPNRPPFENMRDIVEEQTGDHYSKEGVRKMFGRANAAVYNATGVYFLHSSLGLQKKHGIPNETEMLKGLGDAGMPQGRAAKPSDSARSSDESLPVFTYPSITVLLQPPGQSGYITRVMSEEIASVCGIEDGMFIGCTSDAFDRWYSCFCFGLRYSLPKRVYKLSQPSEGVCTYLDNGVPPVTIYTILEMYTLSQLFGTTQVSDMLLDEILKVLKHEKALFKKYKGRGNVCEDDPNDVLRFNDLEPGDIEKLLR